MKITLVAMSGIRAYDPELLRLGLTLPGFVERSKTIASLPSLGLLTLAGMTPSPHEVRYIEIDDIRNQGALPIDADVVAISSFSAQMAEGYELAQRLQAAGTPTVLGGLHVTCEPEEALQFADAVVVGEGEVSWPRVLEDAEAGSLHGVYGSRDVEFDLAEAPMPSFELLDISKYNRLTVQTSRGCPHQCEFCASSVLLSKRYKQKPVGKVLAEIDKILDVWPHPFIEFADDNSMINLHYWRELLPEMKKRHIRWFTETDVAIGQHDDVLELMREAGCAEVLIGLESPLYSDLDGLELHSNWKKRQWPRYRDSIRAIQAHGIAVNGCFVLGLDSHGPDIFDAVFEFARDCELFDVQITIQTPFPGTPLRERLKREGRLLDTDGWKKCTLFDITYQPKQFTVEELARGFRELGVKLYSDEMTRWRRANFIKRRHEMRGQRSVS